MRRNPETCEHRRQVRRYLPLDLDLSRSSTHGADGVPCLTVKTADWCPDCGAALRGPAPDPIEELGLEALVVNVHGLTRAVRRAAFGGRP